jgi:hypothetical protein
MVTWLLNLSVGSTCVTGSAPLPILTGPIYIFIVCNVTFVVCVALCTVFQLGGGVVNLYDMCICVLCLTEVTATG